MSDRLAEIRERLESGEYSYEDIGIFYDVGARDVRYLLARIDALTAENAKLRAALEAVDTESDIEQGRYAEHRKWVTANDQRERLRMALEATCCVSTSDGSYCPWCYHDHWWQSHTHASDCQRQAALATDTERGLPAEPPAADA